MSEVTVLWKEEVCTMSEVRLGVKNPSNYEVLVTAGSLHGHTRNMVVLACYIPPNYTKRREQEALASCIA